MRIVSLLPSATEILGDLGLIDQLVGRSNECNWPPEVEQLPVVSFSRVDSEALSGLEIDAAVREAINNGEELYRVDETLLSELQPDVVITQDLCRVCAVSSEGVCDVGARVISLDPRTITEVADSVRHLGAQLGKAERGHLVADRMLMRIADVRALVAGRQRPRVFFAEWLDPPFVSGHWIPEMVEMAGGLEVLGIAGAPSGATTWPAVIEAKPELVILGPCGFDEVRAAREARDLRLPCPAVPVNADRYFARPAPSIADGVEQLARIFHHISVAVPVP